MRIIVSNKMHVQSKQGFTLMEVVISVILFGLAMAGVFTSISQLRQPAVESTEEVTAAFLGKRVLDDLRTQVTAETWNGTTSLLYPGNTYTNSFSINGKTYTTTYYVENDTSTSARKVTMNITWN